jgi:hypothetical protein
MLVDPSAGSAALRSMPCVFHGSVETLVYAPEAARTNSVVRKLAEAEFAFRGNSAEAIKAALTTTQQILDSTKPNQPENEGWKSDYYAGLAVKASLRTGSNERAEQILTRGLQLEPKSMELNYLSRIITRMPAPDHRPETPETALKVN